MDTTLRFLVVEDDPIDAFSVRRVLLRTGLCEKIDSASSLEEAKQQIREHHYDAVLLDLGLPDSQGVDSIIDFQANAPELPIVVLTGLQDENTAMRSMDIGAEDFINKDTVTEEILSRSLRFAIERHRRKLQAFHDMDALRLSLDDAKQQANTDPLTTLPNRRGLELYLEQYKTSFPDRPLIAAVADLDNFKGINDTYGHSAGDAVLKEFTARVQHCLRGRGLLSRVGGDEFVVVMGGLGREEAAALGRRVVNQASAEPVTHKSDSIPFSITLAMVEMKPPLLILDEILAQTHVMLTDGKNLGKNRMEYSWSKAPAASAAAQPAAGLPAPEELFSREKLVQLARPALPLAQSEGPGYHLGYGLGPSLGPLSAPALSRARLAGRLGEMILHCMGRAAEWRLKEAPGSLLHLDLEADAVNARFCTEMNRIFAREEDRAQTVLYFHTDFSGQPGAVSPSALRLLRTSGFQLGARNVGDGASILENLLELSPQWIRVDPSLTISVGRYKKKAERLERLLGTLRSLDAKFAADGTDAEEDIAHLRKAGFAAYYSREPGEPAAVAGLGQATVKVAPAAAAD